MQKKQKNGRLKNKNIISIYMNSDNIYIIKEVAGIIVIIVLVYIIVKKSCNKKSGGKKIGLSGGARNGNYLPYAILFVILAYAVLIGGFSSHLF